MSTNNRNKGSNRKGSSKRRPNSNRKGRDFQKDIPDTNTSSNHPSWYAANPALLRDAANMPYNWPIGTPLSWDSSDSSDMPFTIPGVCTIKIHPSVGYTDDFTDPINVAANAVYAFVRHANSGHANYDAPDFMIYIMSMSQVYSFINYAERIYGLATLYAQRNRYLPLGLLKAQGINADDILNNLADLRYGINLLIAKASTLAVPAVMEIFNRHAFLYQNVYSEGESVKDQLYMYIPDGFYYYDLDESNDFAGYLEYVQMPETVTVANLLRYGNDMINRLAMSEDMNIMSGDILKAFGSNIIKLTSLDYNFPVVPIYDPVVLEQMKNAVCVGSVSGSNITQEPNKGFLIHQPKITITNQETGGSLNSKIAQRLRSNRILTTSAFEPTPELTMVISRLTTGFDGYTAGPDGITYNVLCGSEIPVSFQIHAFQCDSKGQITDLITYDYKYGQCIRVSDIDTGITAVADLCKLAMFKYHPQVRPFVINYDKGGTSFDSSSIMFNVDNFTMLNVQDITKLHEAALMSEFHVPSIAKV